MCRKMIYTEYMGTLFQKTPELFGIFHISALIITILGNTVLFRALKHKNEAFLMKILHTTGLFMILMEVFKQWYCYKYVFQRQLNLWFFPWQLCSMAMYCAFFVSYLKDERRQNALLVFLSTFSLFSDIIALVLPYDMLRPQIVLTVHSFLYHGLIISCALIAILILKKRKDIRFLPTVYLFLFMALIAFAINGISHALLNNIYIEPNMFYITPAYPTTQPVFHDIAVKYGIFTEIILYLSLIILASYLFFIIERRFLFEKVR